MFLTDIVHGGDFGADCHDFLASDMGSFVDDDVGEFTTATINIDDDQSQSDHSGGRPTHDRPSIPPPARNRSFSFREILDKFSTNFGQIFDKFWTNFGQILQGIRRTACVRFASGLRPV